MFRYVYFVLKSCLILCNDFKRLTGKCYQLSIQENILAFDKLCTCVSAGMNRNGSKQFNEIETCKKMAMV